MGLLQKVWPWSRIESLKESVGRSQDCFDNLKEKSQDQVLQISVLNRDLKISNTWATHYREGSFTLERKVDTLDKENNKLAHSVVTLADENAALKAKLTRKGIKHKKVEPIKNRPF